MTDTTTDTDTTTTPPGGTPDDTTTTTPPAPATDLAAEVAKWKAHAREQEKRAKANAEAATRLAALEDRDRTETERLLARAEAAEKAAAEASLEALRTRVALAKNLPPKLASRLQGDTEADMIADADELLAEIGAGQIRRPNFDGGARQPATDAGDDMNAAIRRAAGRG